MNTLGCALLLLLTAAAARASVTVTRTSSDQPHPSTMELEVALPDSRQKLLIPLTRSTAFDNIPITVLESGVSRRFSSRQVRHPSHSHYTHADSSSVVSVRLVDGNRRMSGHVTHEGVSYSLEPDGESGHRVVRKEASPRVAELVGKRMASSRLRRVVSRRRRQSSTWPKYVVELHLLLDHTVWKKLHRLFRNETTTTTELFFYYAHILNGIDTVYRNMRTLQMGVECVGITIAKTAEDNRWMNESASSDGADILSAMAKYTHGLSADHFMAFTRNDISVNGTDANGVSYPWAACRARRVSLIEDRGLHSWATAAHELGHNLGAEHDGDGNSCLEGDKFVMTPAASSYSLFDVRNSYRFSACSEAYIANYVEGLGPSSCLLTTDGERIAELLPSNQREGARLTLDQVCRLSIDKSTFEITEEAARNPASICASISCRVSGQLRTLGEIRAPVGTSCGNRRSCNWNGECAFDEAAPAADDGCFWGVDVLPWSACSRIKHGILYRRIRCSRLPRTLCCRTLGDLLLCASDK